ncbi:MAG: hypothetical protein RJP95_00290 [Pirellulales bacterium]
MGLPSVAVGQVPSNQVDPQPASAEKQRQGEEELQRLIASRDALTEKIQRLRKITGQHSQVVVSVKVCELSLDKARNADCNVEGVDSNWLRGGGFGEALSAGVFDEPGQTEDASRVARGSETLLARVIENDEALKRVLDELEKAGALKVLAEPTLATVSGRPASLHVGGEFPIPVPQSNGDLTVEFRAFGTQLDVVPVVLGRGRIQLELRPRISEIDPELSVVLGNVSVPGLTVREVGTSVEMNVGQTLVLAGLVQQRVVNVPPENSGDADPDEHPGSVPSKVAKGNTGPNQSEIELIELVVVVHAEILDAP